MSTESSTEQKLTLSKTTLKKLTLKTGTRAGATPYSRYCSETCNICTSAPKTSRISTVSPA